MFCPPMRYYSRMEHDRKGTLRRFAEARGITVIASDATAYRGDVLSYDATGHHLQVRWSLASGLAYATCCCDPEGLAARLFADD